MQSSYFHEFDELLSQDDTGRIVEELAKAPAERLPVLYNKLAVHIFHANEGHRGVDAIREQAEKIRVIVHFAIEQLLGIYMQQGELLSKQNEDIASACKRLLNVQYKAYMAVLDHARKREGETDMLAFAIHRIMVVQLYLHIINYIMYSAIAEKEWLNLHRLFIIARQNDVTDFTIEDEECYVRSPVSIAELYSLSLLMGCASLHQLPVTSIIKAVSCVYELANLVTISDKPQGVENELVFDISAGTAPNFRKFLCENEHSLLYYLHLEKLLEAMTRHRSEGDSLFNLAEFPETLKDHLIQAWSRYRVREERVIVDKLLEATIGFDNIHYYLCGGRELGEFLGLGSDRSVAFEENGDVAIIEDQLTGDIWPSRLSLPADHEITDEEKKSYAFQHYFEMVEDVDTGKHPVFNIKMIDQSPGGCCLEFHSDSHTHLAIGALVGFRDAAMSSHWQIGEVVWLKVIDEKKAHAGIRLLSTEAIPLGIDVSSHVNTQNNYSEGILLPYENSLKHLTSILLAEDHYEEGSLLKTVQKGLVNDLKLTNNILRNDHFAQFNCGIYSSESSDSRQA